MERRALPVASFEVGAEPSMEALLIQLSCVESSLLGGPRVYAMTLMQALELRARLSEEIEALQHALPDADVLGDRSGPASSLSIEP